MATTKIGPELPEGLTSVPAGETRGEAPKAGNAPKVEEEILDGPRRGPKGEYLPASYKVTSILPNGKEHTVIVRDK